VKKIAKVHRCSRRHCGHPVSASDWPAMPFCSKSCQVAWKKEVATFCAALTPQQIKAVGGVRKWRKGMLQAAVAADRPLDCLVPKPRWTSRIPPRPGWGGAAYFEPTEKSGERT